MKYHQKELQKANSGYEEWRGEGAYSQEQTYEFYEHRFALIQLRGASARVDYYQYPIVAPDVFIPSPNQLQPLEKIDFTDSL